MPGAKLEVDEARQIPWMQCVPHLKSVTAEAKILQGAPRSVRMQPVGKDSLLRGAELAGSRQNTAAIDPHRQAEMPRRIPARGAPMPASTRHTTRSEPRC